MQPIATASMIRDAEAAWFAAHPGGNLMGRAASAVAAAVGRHLSGREQRGVLVVAGPGNNAGDALFAVADLAHESSPPTTLWVWPVAGTTHEGGLAAALAAGATVVDAARALELAPQAGVVVDGLSGLGGRAGLPEAVAAVAAAAGDAGVPVVAVDLASGLSADSPAAGTSFRATETVTFIARKLAHVAAPASDRAGRVTVADIGVDAPATPISLIEEDDCARAYPWPDATSDKYSRGVVGLDTGSPDYPGAAVLGVHGALWSGAGMVRFAGPRRPADLVLAAHPSVVVPPDPGDPGRVQAWVCGSGWPSVDTPRLARRVEDGVPVVLDAGALDALQWLQDPLPDGSVLTPHAGELARLLGVDRADVAGDPIGFARHAAASYGATVLLKGATQYAVAPDGTVLIAIPGASWTATAGSGDVLAGAVGTLLAAGLPAPMAAVVAASLQACASRLVAGPLPPERLAERFGSVIAAWGSQVGRP